MRKYVKLPTLFSFKKYFVHGVTSNLGLTKNTGNKLDGGATLRVKNDGAGIWPGLTFSFQYQLVLFGWETSDESSRKTPKLNGEHVWPGIMVIKNCYVNQEGE